MYDLKEADKKQRAIAFMADFYKQEGDYTLRDTQKSIFVMEKQAKHASAEIRVLKQKAKSNLDSAMSALVAKFYPTDENQVIQEKIVEE